MTRSHYLVLGLTLGDEGKGGIVDLLGSKSNSCSNIRFAADPQSAHYIVKETGELVIFGQVGSAMINEKSHAHIGHETLLRLASLMIEIDELGKHGISVHDRLTIDPDTILVLPWHGMAERVLEISRGRYRFGTSGVGSSLANYDLKHHSAEAVRFRHIFCRNELESRLEGSFTRALQIAHHVLEGNHSAEAGNVVADYCTRYTVERIARDLARMGETMESSIASDSDVLSSCNQDTLILEGTQGVLLNPRVGLRPHVSSCDSSRQNAVGCLRKMGVTSAFRTIGVVRAYATRFGPGPLVTEDRELSKVLPELHNEASTWHGEFRAGPLDLITTRYAIRASGGIDLLALNHLDRVGELPEVRVCTAYEYCGRHRDQVERNFHTSLSSGRDLITDVRSDCNLEEVTKLLFEMKPAQVVNFPSWGKWKSTQIQRRLPIELDAFLKFLEGPEGLQTPVEIISFGPRRSEKIILQEL